MVIEKSCWNCTDNENCCLYRKIKVDTSGIVDQLNCMFDEGIFHEVLQEHMNLKDIFTSLQQDGIIKKTIDVHRIDDDEIKTDIVDMAVDGLYHFLKRTFKDIKPRKDKMIDTDFYCSEWR